MTHQPPRLSHRSYFRSPPPRASAPPRRAPIDDGLATAADYRLATVATRLRDGARR